MFKKILLLLAIAMLVSCGSSKSSRSTKTAYKPKKTVVTRKPVATKTSSSSKTNSPENRNSEVIESTSRTVVYSDVVNNYVAQFKDIAKSNMKQYGIPASIILA